MYFTDYIKINIKLAITQVMCYGLISATKRGIQATVKKIIGRCNLI